VRSSARHAFSAVSRFVFGSTAGLRITGNRHIRAANIVISMQRQTFDQIGMMSRLLFIAADACK
jgi:hypothetical protein